MLGNETLMTHISKLAQFEIGELDLGRTVKCFQALLSLASLWGPKAKGKNPLWFFANSS